MSADDAAVTVQLRDLCAEWRALLTEDPPIAHQLMKRLLPERLAVERTPAGVRVIGNTAFGPLLTGIVLRGALVPRGVPHRLTRSPSTRLIAA